MILFGFVLWHINHCRLFNAKSFLNIHIKFIWFGLVWFYGISTTIGYLNPNSFIYIYIYIYIYSIYDFLTHLVDNIFERTWAHFLPTVKWFHLFLSNTNNSIHYKSFVCACLKVFKYCNLTQTIQLNISHLFTHSLIISSISSNSV